jgi:Lrp/AsnC family transcriptional regulator for asnA, asnC and gidA
MTNRIDDVDAKIIEFLKQDGRMPNTDLAKKLKISEATIRKRLRKLIDNEIIQIVAVVNHDKLGEEIVGNIKIKVDGKKSDNIIKGLNKLNGVWYIAHLTGAIDFDVEFNLKTHGELRDLLAAINKIDGVIKTETSFRLQLIKNRYDLETP